MSIKLVRALALSLCFISVHIAMNGQKQEEIKPTSIELISFYNDSLIEKKLTSISNLREVLVEEVPMRVLILDKSELKSAGAQDLADAMLLIPGFSFGQDVDEVIGLSIRGQWAHEGKYLVMYNGIPINELDFGTFCFFQRIALNSVDRIEIIVGPGSVIYGGTAQLGVINIIHDNISENSSSVWGQVGITDDGISRESYGLNGNHFLGSETYLTYTASFIRGARSNFTQNSGERSINYLDSTQSLSSEVYVRLQRKGLEFNYFMNNYSFNVSNADYGVTKFNNSFSLGYSKSISDKHTLVTRLLKSYQLPWTYKNTSNPQLIESNTRAQSTQFAIYLNSIYSNIFESTIGLQLLRNTNIKEERGRFSPLSFNSVFMSSRNEMYSMSGFGDFALRQSWYFLNIGFRTELNNNVAAQFTPRIGLTLFKDGFYFRANHSYAYKIPTLQNLNLASQDMSVTTEVATNTEFMVSCNLMKGATLSLGIYQVSIKNPIVYVSDEVILDSYINRERITTRGFDSFFNYKNDKNRINIGLNISELVPSLSNLPEIELGESRSIQGLPSSVVTVQFCRQIFKEVSASLIYRYQSEISTFNGIDQLTNGVVFDLPQTHQLNIVLSGSFIRSSRLSYSLTLVNAINQNFLIASPYAYGLEAMPFNERQLNFTLSLDLTK
jgi:outer membrane cobalamin receptor